MATLWDICDGWGAGRSPGRKSFPDLDISSKESLIPRARPVGKGEYFLHFEGSSCVRFSRGVVRESPSFVSGFSRVSSTGEREVTKDP